MIEQVKEISVLSLLCHTRFVVFHSTSILRYNHTPFTRTSFRICVFHTLLPNQNLSFTNMDLAHLA